MWWWGSLSQVPCFMKVRGLSSLQCAASGALIISPPKIMKQNPTRLGAAIPAAFLVLATALPLAAQSVPAGPAANAPKVEEETVVLSPFEVSGEKDDGWRGKNTLSGSRLKTDLVDTAASVTVVTAEFLRDFGMTKAEDVLQNLAGSEVDGTRGNFSGSSSGGPFVSFDNANRTPASETRIRGLAGADNLRNYFRSEIPWEGYNIDRFELNRGANSVLYGIGSPAGIVNVTTRAPKFSNSGEFSASYGSYDSYRVTADINQVIIKKKLAFRALGVKKTDKWRQSPTYADDRRGTIALTFQPFEDTIIKASAETCRIEANRPRLGGIGISYQPFFDEGKPYIDRTKRDWEKPVYQPLTNTWVGADSNSPNSIYAAFAGLWGRGNMVYNDPATTVLGIPGYDYGANVVGLRGELAGLSFKTGRDYLYAKYSKDPAASFFKDSNLANLDVFDFRNNLLEGDNKKERVNFNTHNLSIQQFFMQRKLGIELVYNGESGWSDFVNLLNWRGYNVHVDLKKFDDKGNISANYGRPFVMDSGWGGKTEYKLRNGRATAYYELDLRRKNAWLGRHIFTSAISEDKRYQRNLSGSLVTSAEPFLDATNPDANNFGRGIAMIHYIGDSMANMATVDEVRLKSLSGNRLGVMPASINNNIKTWQYPNATVTNPIHTIPLVWRGEEQENLVSSADKFQQNLKSLVLVDQSYWLKDNLVTTVSWRRDHYKEFRGGLPPRFPNRLIDANNPTWMLGTTPVQDVSEDSVAYGGVLHMPRALRKWVGGGKIGLVYNRSSNFQPSSLRWNLDGSPIAAPSGENKEYGLQYETADGKFFARVTRYETSQTNITSTSLREVVGTWARALSGHTEAISKGYNNFQPDAIAAFKVPEYEQALHKWVTTTDIDGVKSISLEAGRNGAVTAVEDAVSKGYELEANWSPTSNLTFSLNAAKQEANVSNIGIQLQKFVAERVLPVVNGPAGKLITMDLFASSPTRPTGIDTNKDGLPYGNFTFVNPAFGETGHVKTLADELNQNFLPLYYSALAREGQMSDELRKYRANFQTRYSFDAGFLKGFSLGGAVRWESKVAIGYPVVLDQKSNRYVSDVTKPYYGPENLGADVFFSYDVRIGKKLKWNIRLNVKDVIQQDALIPVAAQPNGSISSYRITEGTNWLLTNTFSF